MQKMPALETTKNVVWKSIQFFRKLFEIIGNFLRRVGQLIMRGIGIVLMGGGVLAIVGWLMASLNSDPSAATWNLACWLVIVGVVLLAIGMQALAIRYLLRTGIAGQYAVLIFLFGALILIAGVYIVDLFIMPGLFKLGSQFPNLGAQLQGAYNTVQQGANTAASTVTSGATDACNTVANSLPFGGKSSCPSTSAPSVPSVSVPTFTLDDLLIKVGLPTLSSLGILGLALMSGVTLAPGCLVMGIILLIGGLKPRSAVLLLIISAVLNLGGQFFLFLPFLKPIIGLLPFFALAWLGFAIWSPWKFNLSDRLLKSIQPATVAQTEASTGEDK